MVFESVIKVTTTGSAGSATGTGDSELPLVGFIEQIHVNYNGSAPGTTTVDVDEIGGAGRKLLDLAAGNTDATYTPRVLVENNAGTDATDAYARFAIGGRNVRVSVAASDALTDAVIVTIIMSTR